MCVCVCVCVSVCVTSIGGWVSGRANTKDIHTVILYTHKKYNSNQPLGQ